MRILAIESSAVAASAAVVSDGELEAYSFQRRGLTHSQTLLPMIEDMLNNAALDIGDVDRIAVARGPGSFTGLRIGIAAAKGLAFASGKPLVGVSTLAAMARTVSWHNGIICAAMDARRGEVYNALFFSLNGELTRLCDDRAIPLGEIVLSMEGSHNRRERIICVGDGAGMCYNFLGDNRFDVVLPPPESMHQNAVGVAKEAGYIMNRGNFGDLSSEPVYLRLSQAERELAERERNRLEK